MNAAQITILVIGSLIGVFFLSILFELILHLFIKSTPSTYKNSYKESASLLLYYLSRRRRGEPLEFELTDEKIRELLVDPIVYINRRSDCADFRLHVLLRIYLDFGNELPYDCKKEIEKTFLDFRYWMDQPGDDSMCFWSENHQILFAVAEYIVGGLFPDAKFGVDGKIGSKHKNMAQERIDAWIHHRFKYGFSEWNSSNYFPESMMAMLQFIQYSDNTFLVNRMKMIMDLMMYDIAVASFKCNANGRTYYVFNAPTARAYANNKISERVGDHLRPEIDMLLQRDKTRFAIDGWNEREEYRHVVMRLALEARDEDGKYYYELPQVIKEIFNDDSGEIITRSSSSLYTYELKNNGLIGQNDKQIMFQFGMEAFTNREVIKNTLRYLSRTKMFHNNFLSLFKHVDFTILKVTELLPLLSNKIAEYPNGAALQRANIYNYKCKYFSMSTAQAYCPESFGAQQHIWCANISPDLTIFTTQPAKSLEHNGSPSYWVGNGRSPYSLQFKNVNISLYKVPGKSGIGEGETCMMTHAYCPLQYLDEYNTDYMEKGYFFGKAGKTMFMFRTNGALHFRDLADSLANDAAMASKVDMNIFTAPYDLINDSNDHVHPLYSLHYWVTDIGVESLTDKSFDAFIERMLKNELVCNLYARTIKYTTTRKTMFIDYKCEYKVNGRKIDLCYPRYDSPYVEGGELERNPDRIKFCFKGSSLLLDYYENIREEENN